MNKKSPLKWMVKKMKKRLPGILTMTVSHMGSAFLGVAFALMCKNVIDHAIDRDKQQFLEACLIQGLIIVGMLLCMLLFRSLRDRLTADLDRDFKRDLFHRLICGDYTAVTGYHTGELLNRMNNDVRTVNDGVVNIIPNIAAMLTKLVSAVSALAVLEPMFTALVVAAGVMLIGATGLMRRRLKNLHKRVSEEEGRVSGFFQESLEKLLMVQALDVSDELETRADSLLERRYKAQIRRKNVSLGANASVSLVSHMAAFAGLVWCAVGLFLGQLSVGSLTAITQLVNQLQRPFVSMSGIFPQYLAMVASAERLMELEKIEPVKAQSSLDTWVTYDAITSVGAEKLCFSYDRDKIFDAASFELPTGNFAVIVGNSGIGKSTLLKLMLGIIRPESGSLYVVCRGERVSVDRNTRGLFAYVPQGNLLLSGTLRDNLTIVKPDATESQIQLAVHAGAMDEYLPQLPQGLDTEVGENGAGLSEGQLQRLAIARAVLSGAPILLLDECTSALDMRTEKIVLERLRALPGRMCIAVTHRPAALEQCNWQLEISNGKITALPLEKSN